ncbi:hypothetical protein B0H13DRAFT_1877134 [Mycena leptocephala]|nr:hypothetical protein B0H13DRAFT_1877134 [Mycena leptocephala]
MPPQSTVTQTRLNNITTCLNLTICTLETLASSLKSPLLTAMAKTTQSLLKNADTGGELPPSVLTHIAKFTETLHKIHTFVEAQQNGSRVKKFFRQGLNGQSYEGHYTDARRCRKAKKRSA